MKAGHCVKCDAWTWRTALDPKDGSTILLWPLPTSRYASVLTARDDRGNSHLAPGIGYCGGCAPALHAAPGPELAALVPGALVVALVEEAGTRYAHWYTPGYGEWLRAHARDYLELDEMAIGRLMAQWEADRA